MTPERFRTLLDIYGADLRRWPDAERRAAHDLAAQDLPELRQWLAQAAQLDGWLDSHAVPVPDAAQVRRAIAAAQPRQTPLRRAWLWRGAGLAGVGLAGSLAGAFAMSFALRASAPPAADGPERATAFTSASPDWSGE